MPAKLAVDCFGLEIERLSVGRPTHFPKHVCLVTKRICQPGRRPYLTVEDCCIRILVTRGTEGANVAFGLGQTAKRLC